MQVTIETIQSDPASQIIPELTRINAFTDNCSGTTLRWFHLHNTATVPFSQISRTQRGNPI